MWSNVSNNIIAFQDINDMQKSYIEGTNVMDLVTILNIFSSKIMVQ